MTQSVLLTHTLDYSEEEMLLGPELMEELKLAVGDLIEICSLGVELPPREPLSTVPVSAQPKAGASLVLRVTTPASGKSALRLSVLKNVADAFALSARQTVKLRRIDVQEAALDWVELGFKDQHITRGDIWMLSRHLINQQKQTVYLSKTVAFEGVRASVQGMFRRGAPTASGLLVEGTKLRFRSRSAAFFILIQMSREMWEEASDGERFYEKAIAFLQSLFRRWADLGVSHTLSVVLFNRTYASDLTPPDAALPDGSLRDRAGRVYTDYYKLVTENESRSDWQPLISTLKRHFLSYIPSLKQREPTLPPSSPHGRAFVGADSSLSPASAPSFMGVESNLSFASAAASSTTWPMTNSDAAHGNLHEASVWHPSAVYVQ